MGAYFSLRGAGEWDRTTAETMEPSIWTNVPFTPLSRAQKLLLTRPANLQFAYPGGLRQGDDVIQISDVSDLSLLIGFEESAGRLYSALLVHAPLDTQPHLYCRASESLVLKPAESSRGGAAEEPSKSSATGTSAEEAFSGAMSLGQVDKEGVSTHNTEFSHLLLYAVKEGVLAFFAHDQESCEQVVHEIAASYGETGTSASRKGTEAGASLAAALRVKTVSHSIGRAPCPVGRVMRELTEADLNRRFAIRCDAEEQAQCTNCVTFCLRIMLGMSLSVRGYDIRRVCESRPDLGPIVGAAAGEAWENLFRTVRT